MDTILLASGIIGASGAAMAALGCAIKSWAKARTNNAKKAADAYPDSMVARLAKRDAEMRARRSDKEKYRDSIDAAFSMARESGVLLMSILTYGDIDSDKYISRDAKKLLTRITPVMTRELAEKIRDYEVAHGYDCMIGGLAGICQDARNLRWCVEEVPTQYEPPDLKESDRVNYPDLSPVFYVPDVLKDAARKLLGYDDKYVQDRIDLLDLEAEPE